MINHRNNMRSCVNVIVAIIMLASCHSRYTQPIDGSIKSDKDSPAESEKPMVKDPRLAKRVSSLVMKSEMLLGPEDMLEIKVKDHPELTTAIQVDPWGFVKLPYIRPIQVSGLTEQMVEDVLTQKYAEFFRSPPAVEVSVVQYNSQVVYILGAVRAPGRYPFVRGKPMSLRDGIVAAGFPTDRAALWRTWIVRQGKEGPEMMYIKYTVATSPLQGAAISACFPTLSQSMQ